MADNSILTPGYQETPEIPEITPKDSQYLEKDNFLSEYSTDEEKSIVRENLNIPSKDSVYTKTDTDSLIAEKIKTAIEDYLNLEDPHGILPLVEEMITYMVKTDGSTPFILPQSGVDPLKAEHLTTKKYVDRTLLNHLNEDDPHKIIEKVLSLLTQYAKIADLYTKSLIYTKDEIDSINKLFIKKDGSTPFTKALIGVDPSIDSHLTTKRYVDKLLYNHLVDVDPHGFISILNSRLASYIKRKDVYDKTLTYSRSQIDSIISNAVTTVIDLSLLDYMDSVNDRIEAIRKQNYVKQDGSTPFTAPLIGIDAINENELTTLKLLNSVREILKALIDNILPVWITSGPTEATVGMVELGTQFLSELTMQEIMDAIFYGQSVSIEVPKYTMIGNTCEVLLCIHGSLALVETAELYLGDTLIYSLPKEEFENGCTTVISNPIVENTTFTFKVSYSNGASHLDSATTLVSMPVFIGLLPKWKYGNTITMEYLKELETLDTEGTQNRFISAGNDLTSIEFSYKFSDPELRHPFIVVPQDYPDLVGAVTDSQHFSVEAFNIIDMIPLKVDGVDHDIIFTVYIYRLALSSLNSSITFNFVK